MSVDIIELLVVVQHWFLKCGGCRMTDFYNGLFQEDKFMFW